MATTLNARLRHLYEDLGNYNGPVSDRATGMVFNAMLGLVREHWADDPVVKVIDDWDGRAPYHSDVMRLLVAQLAQVVGSN